MNNIGVIQMRRAVTPQTGRATYYFNQALKIDQDDPDYHFNLGYAYWAEKDPQAAIFWLREAVRRNPADGEAHAVLAAALQATGAAAEAARERELATQLSSTYAEWAKQPPSGEPIPRGLERLKPSLEISTIRRIDSVIATGQREQKELAAFHLDRGRRLVEQGNTTEAITELRRALYLSPYEAEAHLLLGRIYLSQRADTCGDRCLQDCAVEQRIGGRPPRARAGLPAEQGERERPRDSRARARARSRVQRGQGAAPQGRPMSVLTFPIT